MRILTNPLSQEAKLKKNEEIITRELLSLKENSKNETVCRIIDIILSEFEGQELLITEEIMQMDADILSTLEKAISHSKKEKYDQVLFCLIEALNLVVDRAFLPKFSFSKRELKAKKKLKRSKQEVGELTEEERINLEIDCLTWEEKNCKIKLQLIKNLYTEFPNTSVFYIRLQMIDSKLKFIRKRLETCLQFRQQIIIKNTPSPFMGVVLPDETIVRTRQLSSNITDSNELDRLSERLDQLDALLKSSEKK